VNARRTGLILQQDLKENLGRPLFWIWIVLLALVAFGLSRGEVRISSGDSQVGGTKAWITSEFALGQMLSMVILIFYAFFLAVIAGMSIIRDEEQRLGELLHATPLTPAEYVWGKFLGVLAVVGIVLLVHLFMTAVCNQLLPNAKADEIRGPFALRHYLMPAVIFGLPPLLFLGGISFAVGALTRKPILVFILPVVTLLFCGFFLWNWSPSWLSPGVNRILMLIEPAGFRWLNETWLKVDRGVDFYNKASIPFDGTFILSRMLFALTGILAVVVTERRFARTLRGSRAAVRRRSAWSRLADEPQASSAARQTNGLPHGGGSAHPRTEPAVSISSLGMRTRAVGLIEGIVQMARFELRGLAGSPGLYLFVPIILLQVLGTTLLGVGAFETPLLVTAGTMAVRAMDTITLLVCLLTLFYTVESLQRERTVGLAAIGYATPIRTESIIFGKALANSLIGVVVILATFVGCVIAMLVQGKVRLEIGPFVLIWIVLLLPTFLLWSSFAAAAFAVTRNRFTAYGVGLTALTLTGYLQMTGRMNWAGNWDLWSVLRWSDLGVLPLDRAAIIENRLLALSATVLFTGLTVRFFPRRESDPTQILLRIQPGRLARGVARFCPYFAVPVILLLVLVVQVRSGDQGAAAKKQAHDYWKQNLATWKGAPLPGITAVDLDLTLEPTRHRLRMKGSYRLYNHLDSTLYKIPLTGGFNWENIEWTLNGTEYKPEDRTRLFVFTPPSPLQHGDTLRIGFSYEARLPRGTSRNGGGMSEFILPAGAVLTSFNPSFVPVPGYDEEIGVEKQNRYEPKVYASDFYKGITQAAIGSALPGRTRIRITGPAEYTYNSVGSLVSDEVQGGQRTVVWESDHPVRFFNVVAGRWTMRQGQGTAIYYHPKHRYNIDEMVQALDASRRYYSEWFSPFPWSELKLSEFPALAFYAQGFPTNITFSEGIGFLAKSDDKARAAFLITAHESAHQWWGNIVTPGQGPGGDVVAEGLAHFSAILLTEQVLGQRPRIESCKRLEERYDNNRQADSERPLVKIDGSKPGDETVTYEKGGWAFWMLLHHMGRENMFHGLQEFVRVYSDGPDYPVLQDLIRTLRPFAPDTLAYDAFTKQWFFEVALPQYRLSRAGKTVGSGTDQWQITVHLHNSGSGTMPVEIAATKGERFPSRTTPSRPKSAPAAGSEGNGAAASPDYLEARTMVTLGPGEEQDITWPCPFEPDRIVVDPDALVLQLERKAAVVEL
jgi:ABC-2 type transport system permease protein